MAFNYTALLAGANAVLTHKATKGTALATIITGALYAASAAGIAIPGWAFSVGPLVGLVAYKLLPVKDQAAIDATAQKVEEVATTLPQAYSVPSDFPQEGVPQGTPNNLTQG